MPLYRDDPIQWTYPTQPIEGPPMIPIRTAIVIENLRHALTSADRDFDSSSDIVRAAFFLGINAAQAEREYDSDVIKCFSALTTTTTELAFRYKYGTATCEAALGTPTAKSRLHAAIASVEALNTQEPRS